MTSTPTACPDCNNCGLPCLNEIHHPRQPDTSARDAAAEILGYHGCSSGDCPHEKQSECFAALVEAGYDAGHARALKEMDAEVARLQGEIVKRNQYKLNEQALANVHEHYEKRLAAAQSEIKRLTGNCEVKDKNKKRLERMYGKLEQQLAAAQNVIDELELNESKMNGALSAKQEKLAAAQRERDQQQEWAMKFQRERDAAESERDSYALEVEALTKAILSVEVLGPRAKFYVDKADAITARRRGGE